MDNPYAPPTVVAAEDLSPRAPASYLEISWRFAVAAGLAASLFSGAIVLLYQVLRFTFSWPRASLPNGLVLIEIASFASAPTAIALLFVWAGTAVRFLEMVFALLFGFAVYLLFVAAIYAINSPTIRGSNPEMLMIVLLFLSQLLTVAVVCWIRRINIRPIRLLAASIIGTFGWLMLTIAAISTIVSPLPNPYDDYAGFTLLTVFWCWTVALQMPVLLKQRLRRQTEQPDLQSA